MTQKSTVNDTTVKMTQQNPKTTANDTKFFESKKKKFRLQVFIFFY